MIKTLPYPQTHKDCIVEDYHGTQVADPYRWLEDDNSSQTKSWVGEQNHITRTYLDQIPFRGQLETRLREISDYQKMTIPVQVGQFYFFFRNEGLQNQGVLYRAHSLDEKGLREAEVFVDPNTFSEDGTAAISTISFSPDDKYMAYSVACSGSDWVRFYVIDTSSKEILGDCVQWVKFSEASWSFDSKGFFYSGYQEPKEGAELSAENRSQRVFYHTLGQDSSLDQVIYKDEINPLRYFTATQSEDGKYIFISCSEGTHGNEILYKRADCAEFKVLVEGFKNDYQIVDCKDDRLILTTNCNAPNYKVVSLDLSTGEQVNLVAEDKERAIEDVSSAGGDFFVRYLCGAQNKVVRYNAEGQLVNDIELQAQCRIDGFRSRKNQRKVCFSVTSYVKPSAIYSYDLDADKLEVIEEPKLSFRAEDYITEQVFFPSKDGEQVSMFIVRAKDALMNGENPLYLYGYGGFNISLTPNFKPLAIALLEQGGIYVEVNLRGGGEYGERWHKAGMLANKQRVFDDFIAAAEYLIAQGYTSKDRLAIAGGSNGGLLVGACLVQRPDLFAVALPAVGVLDMLRYHKFTIGWGWVVEYGNSDKASDFAYLYKYSPLHNIKSGESYPATLITTADHDDRVVPAHSFKFAATLQSAQRGDHPVLLRVDSRAGHGAGKSLEKVIKESADVLSFMMYNTKTKYR